MYSNNNPRIKRCVLPTEHLDLFLFFLSFRKKVKYICNVFQFVEVNFLVIIPNVLYQFRKKSYIEQNSHNNERLSFPHTLYVFALV